MHDYKGQDPIPDPPPLAGKGVWATASLADDGDERDAATAMAAAEAALDRTVWLAWRMIDGISGGGPYLGALSFATSLTIKAAHVLDLVVQPGKTATITGKPNGVYDVIVRCSTDGVVGTAPGPGFRYSTDGGNTYGLEVFLGSGTTLTLTGTGLTVNFVSPQGWFAAQQITFNTTPAGSLLSEPANANDPDGALVWLLGKTILDGPVTAHGTVTLDATTTVNAPLHTTGDITHSGGVTQDANDNLKSGKTELIGAGAYTELRKATGPDADATINPWEADLWIAAPTANRKWTLAHPPGDKIVGTTILMPDVAPGFHVGLFEPGSLATALTIGGSSGQYSVMTLIYTGTAWYLTGGVPS